jgi:hypothetical protein
MRELLRTGRHPSGWRPVSVVGADQYSFDMSEDELSRDDLLLKIAKLEKKVKKLKEQNRDLKSDNQESATKLTQSRAARWSNGFR